MEMVAIVGPWGTSNEHHCEFRPNKYDKHIKPVFWAIKLYAEKGC